ncbi:MAG: hypothetical protein JNJ40_17510 [Bacteroidia bacterium]|nr:hypothetical protein [Bacteroidia bacterium]
MTSKKITTAKYEVTLLEDGIVENFIKSGAVMEEQDVTMLKQHNFEAAGQKPYVILVTPGELVTFTSEARQLAASKNFIEAARAKALLINSIGNKIMGNFYLKVNKPFIKTKIFSDREKALVWLRSIIK